MGSREAIQTGFPEEVGWDTGRVPAKSRKRHVSWHIEAGRWGWVWERAWKTEKSHGWWRGGSPGIWEQSWLHTVDRWAGEAEDRGTTVLIEAMIAELMAGEMEGVWMDASVLSCKVSPEGHMRGWEALRAGSCRDLG